MVSPENEEILYRLNSWDLKIYQYAKKIVFQRVQAVWRDVFDEGDPAFNELLDGQSVDKLVSVSDDVDELFSPYKELVF